MDLEWADVDWRQANRDEPWDGWIDTSRPSTFAFTVAGVELEMVDYRYDGWIRLRIK